MKQILFALSLFSIVSCSKSNTNTPSSPGTSTFSFKANGTSYEWDGVASDTGTVGAAVYKDTTSYLYSLGAVDFRTNGYNKFSFDIMKGGDLHTGSFTYPGGSNPSLVGECTLGTVSSSLNYWNSAKNDSVSITVTAVDNGYVSGTFKASITRNSGSDKLVITDGQFSHIKIIPD